MLPTDTVALYRTTEDLTHAISLTINSNRSRWPLAMVHEIGHFIDHRGIGDATTMASRSDPMLDPWRQAVGDSQAYRRLRSDFGFVPYIADEEELWARGYAQWIAARSGDETLMSLVVQSRGVDPHLWRFFAQWDEDDFAPIADQISRLFRRLGWTG